MTICVLILENNLSFKSIWSELSVVKTQTIMNSNSKEPITATCVLDILENQFQIDLKKVKSSPETQRNLKAEV